MSDHHSEEDCTREGVLAAACLFPPTTLPVYEIDRLMRISDLNEPHVLHSWLSRFRGVESLRLYGSSEA